MIKYKMKQFNHWKTATIVLLMIILLCFSYLIYDYNSVYDMKEFELQISKKDFYNLAERIDTVGQVCNAQTNKCFVLGKLNG